MKHPFPALAAGLTAALLLGACGSSTSVESTYTAPDLKGVTFKKILVVALADDGGLRRSAEDAMAAQVGPPAEAVRSYQAFENESQLKNRNVVAAKMREVGVDGIVTMRPLYDKQEISTMPSAYPYSYHSFYGYYGYGWGASPMDTTTVDQVVGIETNIYTADKAQLVWSGVTKSYNPGDMTTLVTEVAKAVRTQLEKQGLVQPRPEPAKK
jgi:hypothetical protein